MLGHGYCVLLYTEFRRNAFRSGTTVGGTCKDYRRVRVTGLTPGALAERLGFWRLVGVCRVSSDRECICLFCLRMWAGAVLCRCG